MSSASLAQISLGKYAFKELGEQSVKNIAQPIRAFWVCGQGAAPPVETVSAPVPSPTDADQRAEFELVFWESIKESKDPAEFAAYLERYPSGAFTALADARRLALDSN